MSRFSISEILMTTGAVAVLAAASRLGLVPFQATATIVGVIAGPRLLSGQPNCPAYAYSAAGSCGGIIGLVLGAIVGSFVVVESPEFMSNLAYNRLYVLHIVASTLLIVVAIVGGALTGYAFYLYQQPLAQSHATKPNPYQPTGSSSSIHPIRRGVRRYGLACALCIIAGMLVTAPGVVLLDQEWSLIPSTKSMPRRYVFYDDIEAFGQPLSNSTVLTYSFTTGGALFTVAAICSLIAWRNRQLNKRHSQSAITPRP